MKILKEWNIKENYLEHIRNSCAACSKEFKNSWALYSQRGNYCSLCNTNIKNLSEYKHKADTIKKKIREASRAGENLTSLTKTFNHYEEELRKARKYFPSYVSDLGKLFV